MNRFLYHGTSAAVLPDILKNGIMPRGKKAGRWEHTVKSADDRVYLTNAYDAAAENLKEYYKQIFELENEDNS